MGGPSTSLAGPIEPEINCRVAFRAMDYKITLNIINIRHIIFPSLLCNAYYTVFTSKVIFLQNINFASKTCLCAREPPVLSWGVCLIFYGSP